MHHPIYSVIKRLIFALALSATQIGAQAQVGAAPAEMKYVFLKSAGATSHSLSQFDGFADIATGPATAQDTLDWGEAQVRALASDGDRWFAVTRAGAANCFASFVSHADLVAYRPLQKVCNTRVGDGYRGVASDGKLFYTLYWDGTQHFWQSYRSWSDLVDNLPFGRQITARHGDIYKGIGYDPVARHFFSLAQSGSQLYWYKYPSFSDMVAARQSADSVIMPSNGETFQAVAAGPVEPTLNVYIMAGQSNAVGWDTDGTWLPNSPADATIRFFYRIGDNIDQRPSTSGSVTTLRAQKASFRNEQPPTNFGIEMGAGRTLYGNGRRNIAIVKVAYGGTDLANQWNPLNPASLTNILQDNLSDATTQWASQGYRSRLAGVFWMQGEWDARDQGMAAAYQANLTHFIAILRSWSADPCLPFVFGRITVNWPFALTVRSAQEHVAAEVACTHLVDIDDLPLQPGDIDHLTSSGEYDLGLRMGQAYRSITGW